VQANHLRGFDRDRPPVLLLGGLNITRALGLARIPVIVASSREDEPAFASRYCSAPLILPPLAEGAAALEVLLAHGERLAAELGRRPPLLYGSDDSQRLVYDYRAELGRYYALLLNDAEVAEAVLQKDLFQPLAAARQLPIPRALAWEMLERFDRPVLVKPRSKFDWKASPVHVRLFGRRGKARIFANGRALLAEAHAHQLRDEILVQEYLTGDDRQIWSFHGFADEQHRLLDWFIGRKIRTYPALTGESTYLELARDPELSELGAHLTAVLPLKGVFKIDLKRDGRTGRYHVLEVNARYNLWHYLGAANGVNLPRTAYDYLVYGTRPAAPGRYGTRYRWIHLGGDWRAYRDLAARGELGLAGWLSSIRAAPKVFQLFAWTDPMPFVERVSRWARARLPRLPGRLRRWLSTAS
jgi:predicted ATP-grasp superfamily ATP-dependent carboligase